MGPVALLALMALGGDIAPSAGPAVSKVGSGLNCEAGYEALLRKLATTPGAQSMTVPGSDLLGAYAVRQERAVYSFTVPGHIAHPAVMKREIVTRAGQHFYTTSVCGYGNPAAFRGLVEAYDRLNEQAAKSVNERLKERHPPAADAAGPAAPDADE